MITIEAMFDGEVLRPMEPLGIPPNTQVTITVQGKGTATMSDADEQTLVDRFERHFGEIALDQPTGLDNEQIDADLAREYGSSHENE